MKSSTPTVSEYDPRHLNWSWKALVEIMNFDFSKGVLEVLLSGSVGSGKSLLVAHLIALHVIHHPGAQILIGRKTLKALKRTLVDILLKHFGDDLEYVYNKSDGVIYVNECKIFLHSWDDGDYEKVRSLELSMAVIEELTENQSKEFYDEIYMRVGRLPHIPVNLIVCATNPDSPAHWAYDHFIAIKSEMIKVFYSLTRDNPFLPPTYVENIRKRLDVKMARRMLEGEWLDIRTDVIYYAYESEYNFKKHKYEVNWRYPVHICWDFNIGEGKPMSACLFQYIGGVFHFFEEVVIAGARTEDTLEDMAQRGLLQKNARYVLHGDATGRHRDTRSKLSDWQIIINWLDKNKFNGVTMEVPNVNPPVRKRHNIVNGQMKNSLNQRRLFVYSNAKTLDKGFKLTSLKKGGSYIEDDSKPWQHVTTAAGYGICAVIEKKGSVGGTTFERF